MLNDLLPQNATDLERAFSLAMDDSERLDAGVLAIRSAKLLTIPDSFLPFLIYEYGLGEISAYAADRRELIVRGRDWQRVRGTPEALALGLDILSQSATLEEAPPRRARWNLFYLEIGSIPASEALLDAIEGIAALSVPVRSHFWQGWRGYNVRPMEWSRKRWSGAAWSSSSGVRIRAGGVKWSFGRPHDARVPVAQSVLEDLGAWVSPLDVPDDIDRRKAIAAALIGRPVHVALRDGGGGLIGYRRARVVRPVSINSAGRYQVDVDKLEPDDEPSGLYVEAMTGFGDGAGQAVASAAIVWDMAPSDPDAPGIAWAGSGDLSGGVEVLTTDFDVSIARTIRERFRFFLTF
jgi:P2-related tail formation protein